MAENKNFDSMDELDFWGGSFKKSVLRKKEL